MGTQTKQLIDKAFRQSLLHICCDNKMTIFQLLIQVAILEGGDQRIIVYRDEAAIKEIGIGQLVTTKLIGMRFGTEFLKCLFESVHHAFMLKTENVDPKRISLVLYYSKKARQTCVGILDAGKPIQALGLSDIFDAMELGIEQLN